MRTVNAAGLARAWQFMRLNARLIDDATIDLHLDALIDSRHDDGGWDVDFLIWTPATRPEWRGHLTVERLRTLRAHGRLEP